LMNPSVNSAIMQVRHTKPCLLLLQYVFCNTDVYSSFVCFYNRYANKSGDHNIYEGNIWNLSNKSGSQSKAEQLAWRRSQVISMKAQGMTQIEIAQKLMVSDSAIGNDVQYLRQQAKESIKEYATNYLPEQYQICLVALDEIIKRAFDMANTTEDNREKISALELFRDTHLEKLGLLSNASTIDHALEFIQHKHHQSESESASESKESQQEL
jgi:hypothetical protein